MEIDISGRHFKVTEPLKDYITEKVSKLDKFSLKLENAHVVLDVQKHLQIAEITLHGKNVRVTAKEDSTDMYAAFDKCFDVMQLQLSRLHDKVRDHKGRRYGVTDKTQKGDT